MNQNDYELIRKAQKGNMKAFEDLVYRYDKHVLNIAKSFRNNENKCIRLGKHTDDNYKIFSYFQQSSYNVDKNRNEIKAEYTINGGGAKIYLRATNSNIKIQKSN